jgi:hypothetical protein
MHGSWWIGSFFFLLVAALGRDFEFVGVWGGGGWFFERWVGVDFWVWVVQPLGFLVEIGSTSGGSF